MREIKFRAWDERKKVMHFDFEYISSGSEGNDWIVFKSDKQPISSNPHPFENPHFKQQMHIMQFTGLKDKNGINIYEGDILTCNDYPFTDLGENPYVGVVDMMYSQWQLILHCVDSNRSGISHGMNKGLNDFGWDDGENTEWEVIGNIHEHQHLLQRKQ